MDLTIEDFKFSDPLHLSGTGKTIPEALDDRLAQAAANGDDAAFCRLVELHQDRVFHFCYRWLLNHEDAKEAAQDTFIRVYAAIASYEKRGKFTTWLYQISLNLCRDHYKSKSSKQRRATLPLSDSEMPSICPLDRPDESAARSDERIKMRKAIKELPDKLRAAVILFSLEELSQSDCAEVLNCSTRAIEGRLYRARDILREATGKEA